MRIYISDDGEFDAMFEKISRGYYRYCDVVLFQDEFDNNKSHVITINEIFKEKGIRAKLIRRRIGALTRPDFVFFDMLDYLRFI